VFQLVIQVGLLQTKNAVSPAGVNFSYRSVSGAIGVIEFPLFRHCLSDCQSNTAVPERFHSGSDSEQ
jgi:hypothetical protein